MLDELKFGMRRKDTAKIVEELGLVGKKATHGVRFVDRVTGMTGMESRIDSNTPTDACGYLIKFLRKTIRKRMGMLS